MQDRRSTFGKSLRNIVVETFLPHRVRNVGKQANIHNKNSSVLVTWETK